MHEGCNIMQFQAIPICLLSQYPWCGVILKILELIMCGLRVFHIQLSDVDCCWPDIDLWPLYVFVV